MITRAKKVAGGYRLTGAKMWITIRSSSDNWSLSKSRSSQLFSTEFVILFLRYKYRVIANKILV